MSNVNVEEKMNAERLSDEIRQVTQVALHGHITPHMRLIVASVDRNKKFIVRMYLDRSADESDHDKLNTMLDEMASTLPIDTMSDCSYEIVESHEPLCKLDKLQGALYARRE